MKDGQALEKRIENDLRIRRTAKSGAHWNNADLSDNRVTIEAKAKSVSTFRTAKGEIKKVQEQADKAGKDWVYIQETDGQTYALMDYQFFRELWDSWQQTDH